MTQGKQSRGETKIFRVKEGTALGVGEAAERTSETKTRARRASKGPGRALARPRGTPGSTATGLVTTFQGLSDIQISAGVTPPGQVLGLGAGRGILSTFALTLKNPFFPLS